MLASVTQSLDQIQTLIDEFQVINGSKKIGGGMGVKTRAIGGGGGRRGIQGKRGFAGIMGFWKSRNIPWLQIFIIKNQKLDS